MSNLHPSLKPLLEQFEHAQEGMKRAAQTLEDYRQKVTELRYEIREIAKILGVPNPIPTPDESVERKAPEPEAEGPSAEPTPPRRGYFSVEERRKQVREFAKEHRRFRPRELADALGVSRSHATRLTNQAVAGEGYIRPILRKEKGSGARNNPTTLVYIERVDDPAPKSAVESDVRRPSAEVPGTGTRGKAGNHDTNELIRRVRKQGARIEYRGHGVRVTHPTSGKAPVAITQTKSASQATIRNLKASLRRAGFDI